MDEAPTSRPPSCRHLLLLNILTLQLLLMAGGVEACRVTECSNQYGDDKNLQDFQATVWSCQLAKDYLRCSAGDGAGLLRRHQLPLRGQLAREEDLAERLRGAAARRRRHRGGRDAAAEDQHGAADDDPLAAAAAAAALRVARPPQVPPLRPVWRPAHQDVRERVPDVPDAGRVAARRQPFPGRAGHQRARDGGLPRHRNLQGDGDRAGQEHHVHAREDVRGARQVAAALRLHRRHAAVGAGPGGAADVVRGRRARRDRGAAHRIPRDRASHGQLPRHLHPDAGEGGVVRGRRHGHAGLPVRLPEVRAHGHERGVPGRGCSRAALGGGGRTLPPLLAPGSQPHPPLPGLVRVRRDDHGVRGVRGGGALRAGGRRQAGPRLSQRHGARVRAGGGAGVGGDRTAASGQALGTGGGGAPGGGRRWLLAVRPWKTFTYILVTLAYYRRMLSTMNLVTVFDGCTMDDVLFICVLPHFSCLRMSSRKSSFPLFVRVHDIVLFNVPLLPSMFCE